jgi:hypothetical protein
MRRRPAAPAPDTPPRRLRAAWPELAVAVAAFLLVVADLDPTGTYDRLPDGPGLTVDELFNVEQGVRLEYGSRAWLVGGLTLRELFGTAEELGPNPPAGYHLPDHPPLGRYLLGVAHTLVTSFAMPKDWPTPFVAAAARFGSAAAFAVTVLLVGRFATRHYGRPAGLTTAVGLLLTPRVFGHAHLASLETMIGLFYAATVLFVADRWEPGEPVPNRAAILGGLIWGLALLTKVQAILLPVPIAVWALWHWRVRAVPPLAGFGTIGASVFFAGWPWLWFDPVEHVLQYLGRTTDRVSLPVWYLGRVFADRDVPWHYPFVTFAVTVPVGLHALGLVGTFAGERPGWKEPASRLLLACLAFPMLLFAVPGVAVYDGDRLFLVSFPLWAVLIGRGAGLVWERLRAARSPRFATITVALLFATQVYGVVAYRPIYLSYYNLLAGGLAGAERLGFEPTYWGDSVTADLLEAAAEAVPQGGTLAVAPVLHQFQLPDLRSQSPALRSRDIRLVEYRDEGNRADALLVFDRRASLSEPLRTWLETAEPVAAVRHQGVTLAGVYRLLPVTSAAPGSAR